MHYAPGLQRDETEPREAQHQVRDHEAEEAEHRRPLQGPPPPRPRLHVSPQHLPPVQRVHGEHVHKRQVYG